MEQLKSIENLIENFNKLPSIGKKTAERLAYSVLDMSKEDVDEFILALKEVKSNIKTCQICGMYSQEDICPICQDENRDKETLMVVSYPKDVLAFEKSKGFNGLYHILNGVISTNKNIGFEDLNIQSLLERIKNHPEIKEIIIATNPNIDGETTALYLNKKLKQFNIEITRLAYGLQMGGALDYTDSLTLTKSLQGRHKLGDD